MLNKAICSAVVLFPSTEIPCPMMPMSSGKGTSIFSYVVVVVVFSSSNKTGKLYIYRALEKDLV